MTNPYEKQRYQARVTELLKEVEQLRGELAQLKSSLSTSELMTLGLKAVCHAGEKRTVKLLTLLQRTVTPLESAGSDELAAAVSEAIQLYQVFLEPKQT